MRGSALVLAGMVYASSVAAQPESQVPVTNSIQPTMTAIQPVSPMSSKLGGPVIQSITAYLPLRGSPANLIVPQIHFIAPNGNAVLLHRELVATSANNISYNQSSPINIPADAQKQGAVFGATWNCNVNPYYATMRVWIMDSDGNRSNDVQYTVHCNGG